MKKKIGKLKKKCKLLRKELRKELRKVNRKLEKAEIRNLYKDLKISRLTKRAHKMDNIEQELYAKGKFTNECESKYKAVLFIAFALGVILLIQLRS